MSSEVSGEHQRAYNNIAAEKLFATSAKFLRHVEFPKYKITEQYIRIT